MTQHLHSIEDIKDRLLAQIDSVVHHFAPEAPGAYTDRGKYFTLNPGRADKTVGSFVIRLTGTEAGRWNDYATGSRGDILDLCGLAVNGDGKTDIVTSLRAARAFLGLDTEDPALREKRKQQAELRKHQRAQDERDKREDRERRRTGAHRLWLQGTAVQPGSPVHGYLRARGIDLDKLPRHPNVLRDLAGCHYEHIDNKTGEVFEGKFHTMAAAIVDRDGKFQGVHRTYLHNDGGTWRKAPVPAVKKVLGNAWHNGINVWKGKGPRGGKPASLPTCPPGTHVYLTEGIEDALSVALLLPQVRVVAAISLGNLSAIHLPRNVARVTIVADRDEGEEAQKLLARAVDTHRAEGRDVRLWLPPEGCKDINDMLRAAQEKAEKEAEQKAEEEAE